MNLPIAKNSKLSINDRQVIFGTQFFTSINILLMYIKNKIGNTGNFCGILVCILYLRLINLLITNSIYLSIKKNCIYSIRLLLILKSAIFLASLNPKILSNVFVMSMRKILAYYQLLQILGTL